MEVVKARGSLWKWSGLVARDGSGHQLLRGSGRNVFGDGDMFNLSETQVQCHTVRTWSETRLIKWHRTKTFSHSGGYA